MTSCLGQGAQGLAVFVGEANAIVTFANLKKKLGTPQRIPRPVAAWVQDLEVLGGAA